MTEKPKSPESLIGEAIREIASQVKGREEAAKGTALTRGQIITLLIIALNLALLAYYMQDLLRHPVFAVFKTLVLFVLGGAVIIDKDWLRGKLQDLASAPRASRIALLVTLVLAVPAFRMPVPLQLNSGASITVDGEQRLYEAKLYQVEWMKGLKPHTIRVQEEIGQRTYASTVRLNRIDVLMGSALWMAGLVPKLENPGYRLQPTVEGVITKALGPAVLYFDGNLPALTPNMTDKGQILRVQRINRLRAERFTVGLAKEELATAPVPLGQFRVWLRDRQCTYDLGTRTVTRAARPQFDFTEVPCVPVK